MKFIAIIKYQDMHKQLFLDYINIFIIRYNGSFLQCRKGKNTANFIRAFWKRVNFFGLLL